MSNSEFGAEFENWLFEQLAEIAETSMRNANGGSGMPEDSDLRTRFCQIECKRQKGQKPSFFEMPKSVTLNKNWISKLMKRSATAGKYPVLATAFEDMEETAWVHMPLWVFLNLIDPEKL